MSMDPPEADSDVVSSWNIRLKVLKMWRFNCFPRKLADEDERLETHSLRSLRSIPHFMDGKNSRIDFMRETHSTSPF